jgi:hypothetical protein
MDTKRPRHLLHSQERYQRYGIARTCEQELPEPDTICVCGRQNAYKKETSTKAKIAVSEYYCYILLSIIINYIL